jgi:aminoglycoside phosphotransferase (APT) family kinase protein
VVDTDLQACFADWLSERVGARVELAPFVVPGHGGFSNETFVTAADWGDGERGLVLRLAPAGPGLFPDYDLDRQARVVQLLRAHTDVPVAEVLWIENDTTVLGRPFYVMARVEGRIPPDRPGYHFEGWEKDASPGEQARVLDAGLGAMAAIHRVDWERAGLGFLDRPEHGDGALAQELGYWRAYLDWARGDEHFGALETIWEWCVAHRPPEPSARGLVWGDARLGNMVYAEDLSVRAVFDWEMALLGPAELDLGWYLFLEQLALQFTKPLPGFSEPDDMVVKYEEQLGRRLEHLDWYETWGGFRAACIQIPLVTLAHAHGEAPDLTGRGENPLTAALLQRVR